MKTELKTGLLTAVHAGLFAVAAVLLARLAWIDNLESWALAGVTVTALAAGTMAIVWLMFYVSVVQDARAGR